MRLTALAVSADGKRALTGYSPHKQIRGGEFDTKRWNVMRLWDLTGEPKVVQTYKHDGGVVMVGFLPDGKRVVSAGDSTVRMWDMDSGEMLWSAQAAINDYVKAAALSPDGAHILTYGNDAEQGEAGPVHGRLKLFSASGGKLLRIFHQFDDAETYPTAFSPDGKLAYIPDGKLAAGGGSVLDLESGASLPWPAADEAKESVSVLALSPDGRSFVSEVKDGTDPATLTCHFTLREARTGKLIREFAKKERRIASFPPLVRVVTFGPDGKYVISADHDETLRRWDVESGKEVWDVPESGELVVFSADGRTVLSVSGELESNKDAEYDQIEFHLWDAATGKRLMPPKPNETALPDKPWPANIIEGR